MTLDAVFDALLLSTVIVIAYIDYDSRKIPNRLNAFVALLALGKLFNDFSRLSALLPGMLITIVFVIVVFGLSVVFKRSLFGMGDIKLLLALSLYFDYDALLLVFALTFLTAGIYAISALLGGAQKGSSLPMGPYFAIAIVVTVLYGDVLIALLK